MVEDGQRQEDKSESGGSGAGGRERVDIVFMIIPQSKNNRNPKYTGAINSNIITAPISLKIIFKLPPKVGR
jgi:hypothetical protein